MKDLRKIEDYKEEKSVQKRSWLGCIIYCFWDCFKTMGKGIKFDSEDHYPHPRYGRKK